MTWCDAISDALIAQASRNDLKNGANNLNTITTYAFALGGITACSAAGTIELDDGKDVDPNVYFGTYAALIFCLLIASIFLNKKLEPELILLRREREKELMQRQANGIDEKSLEDLDAKLSKESHYNEGLC